MGTETIQIKGPQSEEKGGNTESGHRCYTDQGHTQGRIMATIKTAETEAIQIKGTHWEEKGDNKESGNRGHTDQGSAGGGEGRQ